MIALHSFNEQVGCYYFGNFMFYGWVFYSMKEYTLWIWTHNKISNLSFTNADKWAWIIKIYLYIKAIPLRLYIVNTRLNAGKVIRYTLTIVYYSSNMPCNLYSLIFSVYKFNRLIAQTAAITTTKEYFRLVLFFGTHIHIWVSSRAED